MIIDKYWYFDVLFGPVAKQVTYLLGRLQSDSEIGDCFVFISFHLCPISFIILSTV
jgi:hypothetical protein